MKKLLSALLSLITVITMLAAVDLSAYAAVQFEELPVNSSISFNSQNLNEKEYFSVTLPSTGKITLSLLSSQYMPTGEDAYIGFVSTGGSWKQYLGHFQYNRALGYYNNSSIVLTLMQGRYYFKLDALAPSSKSVDYVLSCSFTPSAESFPESLSGKREQYLSDANYITTDTVYYGQISDTEAEGFTDVDVFAFNLKKGKLFIDFIYLENSSRSAYNNVYDFNGRELDYDYDSECYMINNAGTYYLAVSGDIGDYAFVISQFDYSAITSKVTGLKASKKNPASIKLTWTKKSGVSGYEVQKYNGKKWTTYKTITGNTNSITVSKLKAMTEYKFRVRAYTNVNGEKVTSAYSSTLKASTTSEKVKSVKLKSSVNNKKRTAFEIVTWKPMKDVSGYQIQFGTDLRERGGKGIDWYKTISVKGALKKKYKRKVTYASGEGADAVRIRPYRIVNKKKIYGQWSKTAYWSK